MSFECREPFFYRDEFRKKDVEFITIYVKGQSFILHQIRKMVGMTVSVVRGLAYRSDILKSFESKRVGVDGPLIRFRWTCRARPGWVCSWNSCTTTCTTRSTR